MTKMFVLIATAGRAESLEVTLKSLAACERPPGFQHVVVVENGPRGAAKEIVERLSGVLPLQYLYHPRANKSNALNAALRAITDGLIVFLDDDVICDRALLTAYADASRSQDGGIFYGGGFEPAFVADKPAAWLEQFLPPSVKGAQHKPISTDWPPFFGCNWAAYRRDLFDAGGFDLRFGPGSFPAATGQESEMQIRLKQMGCRRVYLPNAMTRHTVPSSNVTPEFALRRIRRCGVNYAVMGRGASYHTAGQAIREIAHHGPRVIVHRLLGRSYESKFRNRYELAYALGVLTGCWVRLWTGGPLRPKRVAASDDN